MLTFHDILWGVCAPVLIAFLAIGLSAIARWRDRAVQPWGPALAIAGALAAAYSGTAGAPPMPPVLAEGWLAYLGAAAALIGVAATLVTGWKWSLVLGVASGIVLAVTVWLLMRPRLRTLGPEAFWTETTIIAVALIVWWVALDQLAARAPGPGIPLLLALFAGASALVLINARTQSLGQVAGGVAVAVGVIAILGLYFRNLAIARAGVLALAIAIPGLLLAGHFYAEMPRRELILLCAAPLALWAGELPVVRRKPLARFATRAVAMFVVLLIPLVPAVKGLQETMREQSQGYDY